MAELKFLSELSLSLGIHIVLYVQYLNAMQIVLTSDFVAVFLLLLVISLLKQKLKQPRQSVQINSVVSKHSSFLALSFCLSQN